MFGCLTIAATISWPEVYADEGGVSFWLPGQMGSFAATKSDPGWSIPLTYYHYSGDADSGKTFTIGTRVVAGLNSKADLFMLSPTYVLSDPVAGAQASLSLTAVYGSMNTDIKAELTGPGGTRLSRGLNDTSNGFGDLYPMASLKWNRSKHNVMVYSMAGLPVGSYDKDKKANLGTNHWSIDGGLGYTYLNRKTGLELSAVAGVTYNFENTATKYQNGQDSHLDWAASKFLSDQFHLGLVGYVYYQLTGDSGSGAKLGDFKSRVWAIGPQIGYFFKVFDQNWTINLKAYFERDAVNRPEGWNTWLTLSIPFNWGKK